MEASNGRKRLSVKGHVEILGGDENVLYSDCGSYFTASNIYQKSSTIHIKQVNLGQPWWCSGLVLPAAQGVILETLAWSLLLPLPVSLPLSVCVSMNE